MKTFTLTLAVLASISTLSLTGCSLGSLGDANASKPVCGIANGDGHPACRDPNNPPTSNK